MHKILISLIVLCTTAAASAQADNVPRFKGIIKPTSSPIVLRYTSFPKSPVSRTQTTSSPNNGNKILNKTRMSGLMEGQLVDGLIMVTVTIEGGGAQVFMQYSYTPNGEFQGFKEMKINGKDMLSSTNPAFKQMGDAMKSANPIYDKVNGYITGNSIHNINIKMSIMNMEITGKTHGVVRGITNHAGRDALVIDYDTTLSLDGKASSGGGYKVIDISTGFPILSENEMSLPITIEGNSILLNINDTETLELPPK